VRQDREQHAIADEESGTSRCVERPSAALYTLRNAIIGDHLLTQLRN